MDGATNAVYDSTTKSTTHEKSNSSQASQRHQECCAGTRSTKHLTAAQLERKRANDREAQRILRQRTREQIESLERKVIELDGHKQQLQKALQHTSELEAQIAWLQRQLAEMTRLMQNRQSYDGHAYLDTSSMYAGKSQHAMMDQIVAPSGSFDRSPLISSVDLRTKLVSSDSQMATSAYHTYLPAPNFSAALTTASGHFDQTYSPYLERHNHKHPASTAHPLKADCQRQFHIPNLQASNHDYNDYSPYHIAGN